MSRIEVPAEFGYPFTVEHHGNRIQVSRPHDSGYMHRLVFRQSEAIAVADALVDLAEAQTLAPYTRPPEHGSTHRHRDRSRRRAAA